MTLAFPFQDDAEIILYDILDNRSMVLTEVRELRIERQFQGVEELSFEIKADDPRLIYLIADGLIEYPVGRFWLNSNYIDKNPKPTRTIKAKPRWQQLVWLSKPAVFSLLGKTPSEGFTEILAGTGWTLGDNPVGDATLYTYEDIDATVLKFLRGWADITGYELSFDTATKEVHVYAAVGTQKDLGFYYGSNLLSIERDFKPPEVTRMYPYGANNLDISGVNPTGLIYIENYDWYMTTYGLSQTQARNRFRKDYSWTDERFLQALPLFEAAEAYLEQLSLPQIGYKGKVVDLTKAITPGDKIEPGDWVPVHDEVLGLSTTTRVLRYVEYPLEPFRDEVELELFNNGLIDTIQESTRDIDYDALNLIVQANDSDLTITESTTNYTMMSLTSAGQATVAAASYFVATATGTGIVEFDFNIDGSSTYGEPVQKAFVDGDQVEHSWTTFASGLEEGAHNLNWSARILAGSGGGTLLLLTDAGRSVVWTKGAVGVGVNLSPSQFISETIDPVGILATMAAETITITQYAAGGDHEIISFTPTISAIGTLDTIVDTTILPFTIQNTEFGKIEGQGRIPGDYL